METRLGTVSKIEDKKYKINMIYKQTAYERIE